jgi:hypothetical protein
MTNRPDFEKSSKLRDCVRRFVMSSDARCVWASTEQLLAEAAGFVQRLAPENAVARAFCEATPVGLERSDVEHTLHRHWLVVRELAQRGFVRAPFLKTLNPGDEFTHIVVRIREGSACGLDHLRSPLASMNIQRARVEIVCNGVVQFRDRTVEPHTDNMFSRLGAHFGKFAWASRDDMFVIE